MAWTSPSPAKRRVDLESPSITSQFSLSTPGTPGTGHTVTPDVASRDQRADVINRVLAARRSADEGNGIMLMEHDDTESPLKPFPDLDTMAATTQTTTTATPETSSSSQGPDHGNGVKGPCPQE